MTDDLAKITDTKSIHYIRMLRGSRCHLTVASVSIHNLAIRIDIPAPALRHLQRVQLITYSPKNCEHLTEPKPDIPGFKPAILVSVLAAAAPRPERLVLQMIELWHPRHLTAPYVYTVAQMSRLQYFGLYCHVENTEPNSEQILPLLLKSMPVLQTFICMDGHELVEDLWDGAGYLPTVRSLRCYGFYTRLREVDARPWRNNIDAFPSLGDVLLDKTTDVSECLLDQAVSIDEKSSSDSVIWPNLRSLLRVLGRYNSDLITTFLEHRERIGRELTPFDSEGSVLPRL